VHESAPEYRIEPRGTGGVPPAGRPAGIARLLRAVDAANAMARRGRHARAIRVLARCGPALAARGARQDAASAANALGELYLDRGKPGCAATAFQQAREWWPEGEQGARSLLGNGRVLLEQGRLLEAEGALRTAVVCHVDPYSTRARRALAEALILRGRLDAAEEALQGSDLATLSALRRLQGNIPEAARAAARAVQAAGDGDGVAACEAHASAAQVHAVLGDVDGVRRHNCAARTAARLSRVPALVIRVAAESFACLERAGAPQSGAVRLRLLRAAAKLSPLAAARVRCALHAATDADDAMLAGSRDNAHLIERFRSLLAAMHDAPDEAAALQVIVADLLRTVDACSVVVRSGPLGRQVADAGRPWPGEEAFSRPVIEGGAPLMRDGLTPEAAEPIAVGGSILGAIAVRWVTGARPPVSRVRDMLRIASAAAAPVLRALNAAPAAPAADGLSYPDDLLGQGRVADGIREAIRRAAMAPYPVLIEGESGSGKELVARAIHARSSRRARRFCAVNCAALSDDLLEAELFGHARGAFTGAVAEKPGMFEEADHGTIFLDEVAELTARAQAKLLRVLQEGEIRRVGENLPRKVDARVVAASNRRLEDEAASGRFRADLRFRLDVIRITLPPLRDRADDVPWLARRIWSETAARVGSHAALGEDVVAALARYDWPGNVREMQNVMASLAVHGPRRGRVSAALLPAHIASGASGCTAGFEEARLEFERRFVRAALARAGGRRAVAASQLGLSRQGLVKIIKRLGLGE
jgi:DNA-binding NtrC family response regulator